MTFCPCAVVCQWIAGVTVAFIVSLALMIARLRQQI